MMGMIGEWLGIVTGVVCAASVICSMTKTPNDDILIGKLYKILEIAALNIGNAKK